MEAKGNASSIHRCQNYSAVVEVPVESEERPDRANQDAKAIDDGEGVSVNHCHDSGYQNHWDENAHTEVPEVMPIWKRSTQQRKWRPNR